MSGEVEAVVLVWLNRAQDAPCLEAHLAGRPEVVDAVWVAADSDAVVRVRCADMAALDDLVRGLRHHAGAGRTLTHLVLRPFDPHHTRSRHEPLGSHPVPADLAATAAALR
ncbi:Lrp/AsnC ligand binding domain-containing protein [Asanoa sp. WMMD1127]|uniref:Lrp/AsnC ligand binding domain-containing protein n=1 Tax=Asanoa sp. WMMD1127 TaxID=3016107 RepID=UPI0024168488|nr:Lrp/AsnC ligand binding domain-containing protein [Asanoa sp. WMMD1127]MDG4825920.1 Lrp/AsnC ligand binding domain-containing protein [Asanoa sp. WMMD1127]